MNRQRTVWSVALLAALASGCAHESRGATRSPGHAPERAAMPAPRVATPAPTTPYEPPPSVMDPSADTGGLPIESRSSAATSRPGEMTPPPPLRGPWDLSIPRAPYPRGEWRPFALGGSAISTFVLPGAILAIGLLQLATLRPQPSSNDDSHSETLDASPGD